MQDGSKQLAHVKSPFHPHSIHHYIRPAFDDTLSNSPYELSYTYSSAIVSVHRAHQHWYNPIYLLRSAYI